MREKRYFSASGVNLYDAEYRNVGSYVASTQGDPTLYQRGWPASEPCARALLGTDNYGGCYWVARIVSVDTEATEHTCDDRCRMAKSRTCACSCGGANHGIGRLIQCRAA